MQSKDDQIKDLKEQLHSATENYDNNLIKILCKLEGYKDSKQVLHTFKYYSLSAFVTWIRFLQQQRY